MPIIWGLANPKLGERDVTQALLERDHELIQAGQVIIEDKGLAGHDFEHFVNHDLGAHLIRPDRKDEGPRFGKVARYRQWIEAIFDTLKGQLSLEAHSGRTLAGVYARVAARLLALGHHVYKGVKQKFLEDIRQTGGHEIGRAVTVLGTVGYVAKGAALAVMGGLFVVAAGRALAREGALLHDVTRHPSRRSFVMVDLRGRAR